uniref:Tetraspanin n=1 Tax=Tabanus bromius TaxID=304241 RepID=A0A0K8TPE2_TABBR
MTNGGVTCIKYLVFACNLLFALTGLCVIIVGGIVLGKYSHYSNFVGEHVWAAPVVVIVIGVLVFIIGFLGCCGACKENSCMILTFSILVGIVVVAEVGVVIAGYVKHDKLEGILEKGFNTTMEKYNDRKDYRDVWNTLQSELDCCGSRGPRDWKLYNVTDIPPSCCSVVPALNINEGKCDLEHAHPAGCLKKVLKALDDKTLIFAGVGVGVVVIQILTILFACLLYRSFRLNYETV